MVDAIEPLDGRVSNLLKSQVTISCLHDVVRELLQNSLDSGATDVELLVEEVTETGKSTGGINIRCKDNGNGISPDNMKNLGKRFYTSKIMVDDSKEDEDFVIERNLGRVDTFGFRGEALHSIRGVCSTLNIISKVKEYNGTFEFAFVNQVPVRSYPTLVSDKEQRFKSSESATYVSVIDLFGNYPVRKKQLQTTNWKSFISDMRRIAFASLVFKPEVNFKFFKATNSSAKQLTFSTKAANANGSLYNTNMFKWQVGLFKELFGSALLKKYENFHAQFKGYEISAVFGLEPVQTKSYQFVFLNNRRLKNTELMKTINKELVNLFDDHIGIDPELNNNGRNLRMFGKPFSLFPVFMIFIKCELEFSDLTQDPSKEIFFTENLDMITAIVLKIIKVLGKSERPYEKGVIEGSPTKKLKTLKLDDNHNNLETEASKKSYKIISNTNEKTKTGKRDNKAISAAILKSKNRFSNLDSKQIDCLLEVKSGQTNEKIAPMLLKYDKFKELRHSLLQEQHGMKDKSKYSGDDDEDYGNNGCECHNDVTEDIESISPNGKPLISPFFSNLNRIELKRSDLNDINVINQVQEKFILATLKTEFGKSMVVVMDQHACDERVKVESLYKELVCNTVLMEDQSREYNELTPALKVYLSDEEKDLLVSFRESLQKWGLLYDIKEETVMENNEHLIEITHLPNLISQRIKTDTLLLRNGLRDYLDNLKTRKKRILTENKEEILTELTDSDWWYYVIQMPEFYKEIVKSKSCRSAIMFGDKLSIQECRDLVQRLAHCRSPFKCAHGRPSVYPLADLSSQVTNCSLTEGIAK